MSDMNCLIAGLPQSGKSTYIASLWYVVQNSKQDTDLCIRVGNNPPDNVKHLNALLDKWSNFQQMRTANDVTDDITMNLQRNSDNTEFTLAVPDFRGESIRDIINGVPSEALLSWCEKSSSLLYFMNDINISDLYENMTGNDIREECENIEATDMEDPLFDISQMIKPSQDMIILKFLSQNMNLKKVVIGISAWDEILQSTDKTTPKDYLEEASPALYNFITHHFKCVNIIGVSAQGKKYKYKDKQKEENIDNENHRELDEEFEEVMVDKTLTGKRAFVVTDTEKQYDITLPIEYLI